MGYYNQQSEVACSKDGEYPIIRFFHTEHYFPNHAILGARMGTRFFVNPFPPSFNSQGGAPVITS